MNNTHAGSETTAWMIQDNEMPLSEQQQLLRRGTIETNTPVYAKNVAHHAIELARRMRAGQTYSLITAKVFTAFMMEGTIDHLGRVLDREWDTVPPNKKRSRGRTMTFYEKHKFIRKLLRLSNSTTEFQNLRDDILVPLFNFRDGFAHPKKEIKVFEDLVDDRAAPHPAADWEANLTVDAAAADYERLSAYCQSLLTAAANHLESEGRDWLSFHRKYPHLGGDPAPAVGGLRIFWHSLGNGISGTTPIAAV